MPVVRLRDLPMGPEVSKYTWIITVGINKYSLSAEMYGNIIAKAHEEQYIYARQVDQRDPAERQAIKEVFKETIAEQCKQLPSHIDIAKDLPKLKRLR